MSRDFPGAESARCFALTSVQTPCPEASQPGHPYCSGHMGPLRPDRRRPSLRAAIRSARQTAGLLLGPSRGPGPEGWDPELVDALMPLALPLYSWYWRVDVDGVENIPASGPAILVANHAGTLPVDGAILKIAVLHEHGRNPWLLAADLAFRVPGFGSLVRLAGNAPAHREETVDLLKRGELVGIFPEGFKGIGKGWRNRYRLQRFGRGGFVEVAIETGAPIIPVAIVGSEEIYPMIANVSFLARRFGLPYFPITPTFPLLGPLGAVPLPSKWIIAFGEPIPTIDHGPAAADDLQLVLEITESIRERVQAMVLDLLPRRRNPFIGATRPPTASEDTKRSDGTDREPRRGERQAPRGSSRTRTSRPPARPSG